ncbi:hypothetical protein phiAS5_ORF0072 [Aeromonas phage phiAS5]|uniref:Uncharacterized protein n=1 Tax=Aeromonas phage phiAS5 TaxID=879630 RepID=E1A2G9_9CAUD|nr:hypothetical protein phiAS5_ORF0072 [Aeromonas phage phiAS5]ADM79915.1 hypothetical protein phiAS5_ORF0072 [Aeromonas phage phiAS5]BES53314.1 hypothetical protein [Aeromonas phage phiWae14]
MISYKIKEHIPNKGRLNKSLTAFVKMFSAADGEFVPRKDNNGMVYELVFCSSQKIVPCPGVKISDIEKVAIRVDRTMEIGKYYKFENENSIRAFSVSPQNRSFVEYLKKPFRVDAMNNLGAVTKVVNCDGEVVRLSMPIIVPSEMRFFIEAVQPVDESQLKTALEFCWRHGIDASNLTIKQVIAKYGEKEQERTSIMDKISTKQSQIKAQRGVIEQLQDEIRRRQETINGYEKQIAQLGDDYRKIS